MKDEEKLEQLTEFAREFREYFGTVHGVTSDFFDAWLSLTSEDLPGWVEKVKAAYQAVYDWLSAAETKWSWVRKVDEVDSDLRWRLRETIRQCDEIRLGDDNDAMHEVHVATIPMQEMGDHWFVRCVDKLLLDSK